MTDKVLNGLTIDKKNNEKIELLNNFRIDDDTATPAGLSDTLNKTEIIINNTLTVSRGHDESTAGLNILNQNSYLKLKDRSDGINRKIYLLDDNLYLESADGNSNSALVREDELQNAINDNDIIFSNVYLESTGQLTFIDETYFSNITHPNIGFRLNNGIIQFRNESDVIWNNLSTAGSVVNDLNDMTDVNYDSGTIATQPYLKWEVSRSRFENVALSISDDSNPTLSNNLLTNNNNIVINNTYGIIDEQSNLVISVNDSNTSSNHILFTNKLDGGIKEPVIKTNGIDTDIGLQLMTKGQGDLTIDLTDYEGGGTDYGDINIKASNINIQALNAFNYNSGYVKASMNFYATSDLNTSTEGAPELITPNTNNIIFEITGDDGRYYVDLDTGDNGQELNIIYDSNGSNNIVEVQFGSSRLSVGSGIANKLLFNTPGQSCNLLYIQFTAYGDTSRDRWQVINTGAIVQ